MTASNETWKCRWVVTSARERWIQWKSTQLATLESIGLFMKTNKDVRATLCLGIYTTTSMNKTYIIGGIEKSFHLRLVEAKSLLDCWIISLNLYWRFRDHWLGKYENIITACTNPYLALTALISFDPECCIE